MPYYHFSPVQNRQRIQEQGLEPRDPRQNPYWGEHLQQEQEPGIYAYEWDTENWGKPTREDLSYEGWPDMQENPHNWDIWEIPDDFPGEVHPDPRGGVDTSRRLVPAERIHPYLWEKGSKVAAWEGSPWFPGNWGKGLIETATGKPHIWITTLGGTPHHGEYAEDHPLLDEDGQAYVEGEGDDLYHNWAESPIDIAPSGHYTAAHPLNWGGPPDGSEHLFEQAHPALKYVEDANDWWDQYGPDSRQQGFGHGPVISHKAFDDDLADYADRRYNERNEKTSTTYTADDADRQAAPSFAYSAHRQTLAEGPEGDEEAPLEEPYFPTVQDAIEANQASLAYHGQGNHALLRPEVLESALGRPAQYYHYTGSLPQAAAALAHGVSQAQAFEDGNKRTAYWLTHHFLHENGLGHIAPSDDEELADHLLGYGQGTHQLEDTAQMLQDRLGRTAKMVRVSDKLHDFLMNPKSRPDLQTPEAQKFLQHLEQHYHNDKTDALMPWLTREWKKGRIRLNEQHGQFDDPRLIWDHPVGGAQWLQRDRVNHWADFLQSTHPVRRGLGDIMQHQIGDFHQHVTNWDTAMKEEMERKALEGGKVVHQTPDGYTVRQLTTPDELTAEGNAMGHCVGSYADAVKSGDSLIYSLRDAKGYPHTTLEIEPQRSQVDIPGWVNHYYKGDWNTAAAEWGIDPNALQALAQEIQEGRKPIPATDQESWLIKGLEDSKSYQHPIPHSGQVVQIQGRSDNDANIKPEYKAALKNWFDTFSPEDKPKWGEGYYGDELEDARDIKPEDLDPNGVDEYGLQPYRTPVNWTSLVQSTINSPGSYRRAPYQPDFYDHRLGDNIYQLAKNRGKIRSLHAALEPFDEEQYESLDNWMDANYRNMPGRRAINPHTDAPWESDDEADDFMQQEQDEYRDNLADEHPGIQAAHHMYSLLRPHWNPITDRYENDIYQPPVEEFGLDKMQRPGDNDQEVFG